jgi:hypothetical protein
MTVSAPETRLDQASEIAIRSAGNAGAVANRNANTTSQPRRSSDSSRSFAYLLLLAIVMVAGFALRVRGTHNDLWLDELISLRLAKSIKTPWQVFTAIHRDNNHYLNTLYLFFLRGHEDAGTLRFFSVLCGVALIGAGYWLLANRSRVEALILASLLAFSYPLIHICSEARGYAGALLGTVVACAALERWLASKKASFWLGSIYGIASAFAILSQLTSCVVWLPLLVASLLMVANRPERTKGISLWVALNLLPGGVLVALYFLDLRFVTPMGATPMSVAQGLSRLLALGIGWPAKDAITVWTLMVPVIVLIAMQLRRENRSGAMLPTLIAPIYLVPLVGVAFVRPLFFSPRYFLVILPFIYVYVAILLARLTGSRMGRVGLAALLILFLAGQAFRYGTFLQVGRGQIGAALEYMSEHRISPEIRVASSQDFRSAVELGYFAPSVMKNGQFLFYVAGRDRSLLKPDWYIVHGEGYESPGPAVLTESGRPVWRRAAYFGASELSGQAWTLYRREPN